MLPAVAATELDLSTLSTNVSNSTRSNLAIAASLPSCIHVGSKLKIWIHSFKYFLTSWKEKVHLSRLWINVKVTKWIKTIYANTAHSLKRITFRMFFKWSTEISPLENFLLAYAARVDCNSYMITPLNLDIPKKFDIKYKISNLP